MDRDANQDAEARRSPVFANFGAVVIGRNEGHRLVTCLNSLSGALAVYVDSGSTDGSVQAAQNRGIDVVDLDLSIPFTAARARNAGFARLLRIAPKLQHVQFVDGDCELLPGWAETAVAFLESRPDVAAACGRLRERFPDRSIYNWLCDREWDRPAGDVRSCAGNVMMRVQALKNVGGYRNEVIAGEEEELCVRLRAANWQIWRLPDEMALHDAAMTHFRQWWKRSFRAGYAFAHGAYLHGARPERMYIWESRRAILWGLLLPLVSLVSSTFYFPVGLIVLLVYPLQLIRTVIKSSGSVRDRAKIAFFHLLGRFPESLGQIAFWRDKFFRWRPQIIEYK